MNRTQPGLKVIEKILRQIERGEEEISQQLGFTPDEFDRYCGYLMGSGLIKAVRRDGQCGVLRLTTSGKALLTLVDKLDWFGGAEFGDGSKGRYGRGGEPWQAWRKRERAEVVEMIRGRLVQAYVLEEAEVVRLEAQLGEGEDEEGEIELERRCQGKSILRNLLDTFQHLAGEQHE